MASQLCVNIHEGGSPPGDVQTTSAEPGTVPNIRVVLLLPLPAPFEAGIYLTKMQVSKTLHFAQLIIAHWESNKAFYMWHMWNLGAEKLSGDMTFKRAKFIVTKQGKRYAPQWTGVYQILKETAWWSLGPSREIKPLSWTRCTRYLSRLLHPTFTGRGSGFAG